MPLYDYRCAAGHTTTALVKIDQSDAPTQCEARVVLANGDRFIGTDACGEPVERVLSAPSGTFPGAGTWRGGR